MKKQSINQNISRVLLIKILLASTLATTFFTGISFYLEYNNELKDLNLTFEHISKTSIPGLAKSLYDIDEERVKTQLNGFLQIHPFVRTIIKDERNIVISDMKEEGVSQIDLVTRDYPLNYWNGVKNVFLGKLSITATQQYMKERLKKKLIYFFFSQAIKTFIVSLIIVLIFNYYIVRHLNVITNFYENLFIRREDVDIGDKYKKEISLNKKPDSNINEIDFLVSTMNKMNLIVGDIINKQKSDIVEQKEKAITNAKFAAIGELAAGVGHEINNPLTIAIGNLHHLRVELENLNINDHNILMSIKRQEAAHDRINNIVKSLRTYSRTDSEYNQLIDAHELINNTKLLIGLMYEKQGIKLKLDLAGTNSLLLGDLSKFQQSLIILLSNAKDATEDCKNPIIKVSTKNIDHNLVISVSDNGSGISDDIRKNIFDSFYTTKVVGKGIGIGLSILKTIISEMNGTIQLDSELGVGSTFSLIFPIGESKKEEVDNIEGNLTKLNSTDSLEAILSAEDFSNNSTTQRFKDKLSDFALQGTALVVDDEEGIRELLFLYLEDMGLEVETADDGDTALEMVKLKKYDYICTDMTMPRMTGDKFIIQAKKHPFGQTKYFIITGGITSSYSKEKEEAIKKEVEAYIYKPFTHEKIFNALSGKQNI